MTPEHDCKGAFVEPHGWFEEYSRFLALTTIALLVTAAGSSASSIKEWVRRQVKLFLRRNRSGPSLRFGARGRLDPEYGARFLMETANTIGSSRRIPQIVSVLDLFA